MRIVVHTINYRPELTGVGKYTSEMCEWLAAQGHDVTVIAPPPYYPRWRVDAPYHQWRYETSRLDGVRVRRAPIWIPRRPGGMARVAYVLSFALSSFPLLLAEAIRGSDLVLVIQPSFLNSFGAWIAARLGRSRTWLHVQDFEIDLAYDLRQLTRGRRLLSAVESLVARRFDVVSAISRRMVNRACAKGVDSDHLFLFPNWFDASAIYPIRGCNPFRSQLNIPANSSVALFSGSLSAKQGLETIIQAARTLEDLPLTFVISGEGVAEQSLKAAARDLRNIRFMPLQAACDLNALLNLADIHLLPQRQAAAQSVFPSKLIGMLASGRPVVAMSAPGSEIAELVDGCGVCVDHNDLRAFSEAIRRLVNDPAERKVMGEKARECAMSRFRQDAIFPKLEAKLSTVIGGPERQEARERGNGLPDGLAAAIEASAARQPRRTAAALEKFKKVS